MLQRYSVLRTSALVVLGIERHDAGGVVVSCVNAGRTSESVRVMTKPIDGAGEVERKLQLRVFHLGAPSNAEFVTHLGQMHCWFLENASKMKYGVRSAAATTWKANKGALLVTLRTVTCISTQPLFFPPVGECNGAHAATYFEICLLRNYVLQYPAGRDMAPTCTPYGHDGSSGRFNNHVS